MDISKTTVRYYTEKGYSLDHAQRLAKRHERKERGRMPGFSEEFIRPMWILPRPK